MSVPKHIEERVETIEYAAERAQYAANVLKAAAKYERRRKHALTVERLGIATSVLGEALQEIGTSIDAVLEELRK